MEKLTPIRQQYLEIKRKFQDMIVLFQIGDFFETFDEDAGTVSRELGIALTSKQMGKGVRVPLAGIPVHALEQYIGRLIKKGYKVAVCEQLTPPGKKLIKRDVTRVITPGTVIEPNLLEGKTNNYLASAVFEGERAGIAYVDITTGEFSTTQLDMAEALKELERLRPSEILIPKSSSFIIPVLKFFGITHLDDRWFELEVCRQTLIDQFKADSLTPYGCEHLPLAIRSAGSIVYYLSQIQKRVLEQLTHLSTYCTESFMELDPQTLRNLEVFQSSSGSLSGSLLSVIDFTRTPMGGRLLKKWLRQPLLDIKGLAKRHDVVEWFYNSTLARTKLEGLLNRVFDIERLMSRVKSDIATPRELVVLGHGLRAVPEITTALKDGEDILREILSKLKACDGISHLISRAIVEDPPGSLDQGGVIKDDYSKELDQLRPLLKSSKKYMAGLESRERERTGIKSLKVGYNKVFGYYIEVTRPNLRLVPTDYIRKQTLVNAERFVTLELKEYESLISNAKDRIIELETSIFRQICNQIGERREEVMSVANALAYLDVFSALAESAVHYNYIRPELTAEDDIIIKNGRHPMIEHTIKNGKFVSNDTHISKDESQVMILTAPNSSGKSTYLRQAALIVLLSQIGSFVPADSANIGIIDRIFTRVGLQDYLTLGQSSFMVEMTETASILNNATPKSLIILDEIGRGTSTYDGLSISRAVIEFIHNHPKLGSKTLFATHYHELTELADFLPRVRNFHMMVTEEQGKIIFLRKVVPGRSGKSYGVQVAKLAGLPRPVIRRAEEILAEYEGNNYSKVLWRPEVSLEVREHNDCVYESGSQHSSLRTIIDELLKLDINSMTPVEAITKLYQLQKKASE